MKYIGLRSVLSGVAVAVIIGHRHFNIKVDAIDEGLLCLASIPWLAPLIKSIEIPGVGKIEMQEIKERAEEARGAAESASQKAEFALAAAWPETERANSVDMVQSVTSSWLEECAAEYNHLREVLPSGSTRTTLMTRVVSKITKIAPRMRDFDVSEALKQEDRGKRLCAYAFLYSRPEWNLLEELISSVVDLEDKPFGQYWGILAIQRVIGSQLNPEVPKELIMKLSAFWKTLDVGTDRSYELSKIISQFSRR